MYINNLSFVRVRRAVVLLVTVNCYLLTVNSYGAHWVFPTNEVIITDDDMAAQAAAIRRRAQNEARNDCLARNSFTQNGTYSWAFAPAELPDNYETLGFGIPRPRTMDLDNGFCQVAVTAFTPEGDRWTAFFALGDTITCGSWVDSEHLYDPFIECAAGFDTIGQFGDVIVLQ